MVTGGVVIGAAAGLGLSTVLYPVPTLAGMVLICSVIYGVVLRRYLPTFFLAWLGLVLLGYALLGRGFAYLGAAPIYIGEVTLAFGVLAAIVGGRLSRVFRLPVAWLIVAFALWGAVRTIPFIPRYGSDALRDGAVWGYGVFALVVPACFLSEARWLTILRCFRACLPYFLAWVPIAWYIVRGADDLLPVVPGTDVKLLVFNHALVGVHLAGTAAFVLLGLDGGGSEAARGRSRFAKWLIASNWALAFLIVASVTRSGLLAIALSIGLVAWFRPIATARKIATACLFAAITVVAAPAIFVGEMARDSRTYEESRRISPSQIAANFTSIVSSREDDLAGTRTWRLQWWRTILDYTWYGDYFWTGKGFGVSLAEDDGFETITSEERPNRSPHNGYFTILARAGVPGAALWLLLQTAFATTLTRGYFRAMREGRDRHARIILWLLAYWGAFLVQSAFDVFVEGPPGGISFWTVCGLGIAAALSRPAGESGLVQPCF